MAFSELLAISWLSVFIGGVLLKKLGEVPSFELQFVDVVTIVCKFVSHY